jgi:hypothetical protein
MPCVITRKGRNSKGKLWFPLRNTKGKIHVGVLSAMTKLALKMERRQMGTSSRRRPEYSLAELLEVLGATDDKPDSDVDMDDGSPSSDYGDDGLGVDMER